MLEIGEHVAACGHVVVHAAHHGLSLFAAVLRLAITIVGEVGGKDVRRYSLLGLRNAESAIVLFQTSENIICEPGFVAKFKRDLNALRQSSQKFFEQFGLGLHIGRKLKQHWAKLSRLCEWLNGAEKTGHEVVSIFQSLDVRDHLMRLDPEAEALGSLCDPFLRSRIF